MNRVDEMREVVNKLASDHAARRSGLDALRRNVWEQRTGAAEAVSAMAAERAAMSVDLRSGLAADLLGLRHEVQTTLDDFLAERQSMAAALKEQLDATREQREEHVTALRTEARQFVGNVTTERQAMAEDLFGMLSGAQIELSTGVRTLLGDFTTQRVIMSQAQDESLAANGAERRSLVAEMIAHTQDLLNRFTAEQEATAARLHETLTADRIERQQLVAGMIADIQTLLKNIAADNDATATEMWATLSSDQMARSAATADFMADVHANRQNMATELRATLNSHHKALSAATAGFIADANADRQNMAEALANRLDAFMGTLETQVSSSLTGHAAARADLHRSLVEVAQLWREFAAALRGTKVAAQPEPAPPVPLATEPPTEVVLPAEDVNDRLLVYLAEHAEGVKLVELEPVFELSRPQLGKHLRALVDSGKVVKDPETLIYKLA